MPAYTTARASGAASWNLTAASRPLADCDERDLRQRREPVDRPVRIGDQARLVDDAGDRDAPLGREHLVVPGAFDGLEPRPPRLEQVLDVLPLVVDLLASSARATRPSVARRAASPTVCGTGVGESGRGASGDTPEA
jgi:hypothetical protein